MPKIAPKLTDAEIAAKATMKGMHAVGGVKGLHLSVSDPDAGTGSWVYRFSFGVRINAHGKPASKRHDLGLGPYPTVSPEVARELARAAAERVARGENPIQTRKAERAQQIAASKREMKFAEAAAACHEVRREEFSNPKHREDWISSLRRYVFPKFGNMRMGDISNRDIADLLKPIWKDKAETASRVRQRIESVFSWAIVYGCCDGPNPARWEGNLAELLPKQKRVKKHHPALPWQDVPAFIAKLRKMPGTAARALEFVALTAARSGEARLATWDEIDFAARVWRVPGDRMKARKPHTVPLSDAAIELLQALPRFAGNQHLFPSSIKRGGALSDMALLAVLRRMNVEIVPHGFRSSFKEWARGLRTPDGGPAFADEVSELALAHVNSDATRSAYARDSLLGQRRELMALWGAFLAGEAAQIEVE